jgi:hypothetical protein
LDTIDTSSNTTIIHNNHPITPNLSSSSSLASPKLNISPLNHAPPGLNHSHNLQKQTSFHISNNNDNNNDSSNIDSNIQRLPSNALLNKLKRISTVKLNHNDHSESDKLLNNNIDSDIKNV